jgi:hypothetical protein
MNKIYGLLFIIFGIILIGGGIYTGLWVMLVGGIVDLIEQIRADRVDSMVVAISIVKIIFCEFPVALGVWFGLFLTGLGIKFVLTCEDYFR